MLRRRDKGSGTIRQRKDGRWEGRIGSAYVYGRNKKAVQDKLFRLQGEPEQVKDTEKLTVEQWLNRWLEDVKANPQRRYATYALYKNTADKHIIPYIGAIKLARLTKHQVYGLLDTLTKQCDEKGNRIVGDRTRQLVHGVLHRTLCVALKRDKVSKNVAALVEKPPAKPKDRRILQSPDEVLGFRKAAKGTLYFPLYITALETGLRVGELLALKWDAVDLNRATLHVRATLTRNGNGALEATATKTARSNRAVKLSASTVEVLREHQKQQMASKQGLSIWVFPDKVGNPTRKDGYLRGEFRKLVKEAKVPGLSLHGLRHTHATMLADLGVHPIAAQERLGHSNIKTTLGFYTHVTTAMQDQAVEALDKFNSQIESPTAAISGQISGQSRKNLGG